MSWLKVAITVAIAASLCPASRASELPGAKPTARAATSIAPARPTNAGAKPSASTSKPAATPTDLPSWTITAPEGTNLVVNGSFEYPKQEHGWKYVEAPSNYIYGWQVSSGDVDLFNCKAPSGSQAVDIEGQDAGTIRQAIKTTPGVRYELKYCAGCHPMGGGPIKKWFVRAADQAAAWAMDCTPFEGDKMGWRQYTWHFTAKKPITILEIGSLRPGGTGGAMIDDVYVVKAGSGTKKAAANKESDKAPNASPSATSETKASPAPAGKNLIVNGSFEQSVDPGSGWVYYAAGSDAIYGWRVASGNIDLWGGITTPWGQKTIDLQGQCKGSVAQVIPTEPGATYRLKFCVGSYNNLSKSIFARAAGKKQVWPVNITGSTRTPGFFEATMEFKARDEKTTIEIGSATDGTEGPVLDNVSCVKIADPTPAAPVNAATPTAEASATPPDATAQPPAVTPASATATNTAEEEEEEEEETTTTSAPSSPASPAAQPAQK